MKRPRRCCQAREELARQKDEEVKAAAEATEEQAAEAVRAAQREAERQKFYQDTNVWLWPEPDAASARPRPSPKRNSSSARWSMPSPCSPCAFTRRSISFS